MYSPSELNQSPPPAPERWVKHCAQRSNAKAAAVCEAVLFNRRPTFAYACDMAAIAVRTPGGLSLPPEIWQDIFLAGVEDRIDQTLCAGLPSEAFAFEREERRLLERVSLNERGTPSPQRLNLAWKTLKGFAPATFHDYGQPINVNLFVGYFDQSKIVCSRGKGVDISAGWDRRSISWWIRNLLKKPMPIDLHTQDKVLKERAYGSWGESPVRPAVRNTYLHMDLPTKRLNEIIKNTIIIADAIKFTRHAQEEEHKYRGYTLQEMLYGIAHPLASSRERNYIHARREWILSDISADGMRNDPDFLWQILQAQRSLLSAAWKYIGRSARTMGFDPRCANASGGWRPYLLNLLDRDQDGSVAEINPPWKLIADHMEKPVTKSRRDEYQISDDNDNWR